MNPMQRLGPDGVHSRMQSIEKKMLEKLGPRAIKPDAAPVSSGMAGNGEPSFSDTLQGAIGGVSSIRPMQPNLFGLQPTAPTGLTDMIRSIASQEGVDPNLVQAVVGVESNFNPTAVSPVGAKGLMQLMPKTAEGLGVSDPFDPEQNVRGGAKYLRQLLQQFGDLKLAVAAYNAGPGAVSRYNGIPPYSETQAYVQKVLSQYNILGGSENHG